MSSTQLHRHSKSSPPTPFGFSSQASKPARRTLRRAVVAMSTAALVLATVPVPPSEAQTRRVNIIRDAELEKLVRDYARPILGVAGVGASHVEIVLVADNSFNAFVADGRRIFVHSGAILESETPNELIGVIAHETGHLAGGHLARLRDALSKAKALSLLAGLLGAGAVAGGIASGSRDATNVGQAVASSGSSFAQRSLLAYMRTEESAADRAAFSYLQRTRQSSRGMLRVFERFADQALFASRYADPYVLSHPMPRERISQMQRLAASSRYYDKKDPPDLLARHALARAKLLAFTAHPKRVNRAYPKSDKSLAARYARAIVTYRYGKPSRAVKAIDNLIRSQPKNPFFWELKGQTLVDAGRPKDAIDPLRKAITLAPDEGLIRIALGQALVAAGDKRYLDDGIRQLRAGLSKENASTIGFRYLAQAYARKGNQPLAELATAQGNFIAGNIKQAKVHAKRAQAKLKRGSPAWLQADDIISYKAPKVR